MRAHSQAGQNIVELALVMSLFLTVVLGLIDFGRVFYTHIGLTNAVREGARYATLTSPACDVTAIRVRTQAEQPTLITDPSIITVNCSVTDRRTVSISNYPFQLVSPFLGGVLGVGGGPLPISTSATLPVLT